MTLSRVFVACLLAVLPALAQPPFGGVPNISATHIHLNSADPDAAMAFWRDVMGSSTNNGEAGKGVSTMGASILLTPKAPSGPSAGSAIDHLSLKIPDLQPLIERLSKTPYKWSRPQANSDRLIVDGPDGVRLELIEDNAMYTALQFDHIDFHAAQPEEMRAWYIRNLNGRKGMEDSADAVLIPGMMLTFTKATEPTVPSADRAIDHVSFEVKDLDALCKKLAASGAKIDVPPHMVPEMKTLAALVSDPWGTRIELTERAAR